MRYTKSLYQGDDPIAAGGFSGIMGELV